jgi:hypothetical protein
MVGDGGIQMLQNNIEGFGFHNKYFFNKWVQNFLAMKNARFCLGFTTLKEY